MNNNDNFQLDKINELNFRVFALTELLPTSVACTCLKRDLVNTATKAFRVYISNAKTRDDFILKLQNSLVEFRTIELFCLIIINNKLLDPPKIKDLQDVCSHLIGMTIKAIVTTTKNNS